MNLLVHSTVAGVGLSLGRDIYRQTRNNFWYIVFAAIALAGTAYGFWNMTRGHDRGTAGTIFVTFLMNIVIISVSFGVFMFCVVAIAGSGHQGQSTTVDWTFVFAGLVVQAVLAGIGLIIGLVQRPKRLRAIKIDAENEQFLIDNGFRDVGGKEQTMLDANDNELVLDDFRQDAITFKVKGRRGVRAKIMLDDTGRMISYLPV